MHGAPHVKTAGKHRGIQHMSNKRDAPGSFGLGGDFLGSNTVCFGLLRSFLGCNTV